MAEPWNEGNYVVSIVLLTDKTSCRTLPSRERRATMSLVAPRRLRTSVLALAPYDSGPTLTVTLVRFASASNALCTDSKVTCR